MAIGNWAEATEMTESGIKFHISLLPFPVIHSIPIIPSLSTPPYITTDLCNIPGSIPKLPALALALHVKGITAIATIASSMTTHFNNWS